MSLNLKSKHHLKYSKFTSYGIAAWKHTSPISFLEEHNSQMTLPTTLRFHYLIHRESIAMSNGMEDPRVCLVNGGTPLIDRFGSKTSHWTCQNVLGHMMIENFFFYWSFFAFPFLHFSHIGPTFVFHGFLILFLVIALFSNIFNNISV